MLEGESFVTPHTLVAGSRARCCSVCPWVMAVQHGQEPVPCVVHRHYAVTGAAACFSIISLSLSLAAPTSSSTFSPPFQTCQPCKSLLWFDFCCPKSDMHAASLSCKQFEHAAQGHVNQGRRAWKVGIALIPASVETAYAAKQPVKLLAFDKSWSGQNTIICCSNPATYVP